jgi:hypothetical protein
MWGNRLTSFGIICWMRDNLRIILEISESYGMIPIAQACYGSGKGYFLSRSGRDSLTRIFLHLAASAKFP